MINIQRGPEPVQLTSLRNARLKTLRTLPRSPTSNDIDGYRIVSEDLWKLQYHKCCYCESRIPKVYNDVEHYRPKAAADRRPGCLNTHGYWWLAFSWDNLLFSCPECNRSHKNSQFPLDLGGVSLMPEEAPPGNEIPLLIDPGSSINPVEHIEFIYRSIGSLGSVQSWWARPRNGSKIGNHTIQVCGLNRGDLRETRDDYYATVVLPESVAILDASNSGDLDQMRRAYLRALDLLKPRNIHVGLTYDALCFLVSDKLLRAKLGVGWPTPNLVPM